MTSPFPFLQSAFTSLAALSDQPAEWQDRVLGAISFADDIVDAGLPVGIPVLQIPVLLLSGRPTACEVWLCDMPVEQGNAEGLQYRYNSQFLFGVVEVPELASPGEKPPLQQATENAYGRILELLKERDFPFVYRYWNYLSDINGESAELERYRQFNLGRQEALLARGKQIAGELPAACTLGLSQGPLRIAFLAGRAAAVSIENPRQMNAYQYPQQYGPRSPTFSRANLLQLSGQDILFISGTASIVGHETMHRGDAVSQTREAMTNLQTLVDEAEVRIGKKLDTRDMLYRVYVRHAEDLEAIQNEMRLIVGTSLKAVFVQADICRSDLLVEIEATIGQPVEFI
jgi:chorismate lyase/3-hydroxybenzoate synthase